MASFSSLFFERSAMFDFQKPPEFLQDGTTREDIHKGVGAALSNWEAVEFRLSRLYSVFAGRPNDLKAIHEYGDGRIFRDRARILRTAADKYFQANPSQEMEGAFDELAANVVYWADARNNIAHGVAYPISAIPYFQDRFGVTANDVQFALIPPIYAYRKHSQRGEPIYVYGTPQLNYYTNEFARAGDITLAYLQVVDRRATQPKPP